MKNSKRTLQDSQIRANRNERAKGLLATFLTNCGYSLVICVVLLTAISDRASAFITPNANTDISSVVAPGGDWEIYTGVTESFIRKRTAVANLRLTRLEVDPDDRTHFTVVMVKNTGPYAVSDWWWYPKATERQIKRDLATRQGRLIDAQKYSTASGNFFAAIMIPNTGAQRRAWWWEPDASSDQLAAALNKTNAAPEGGRITSLKSRTVNGQMRFTAIMVRNSGLDGTAWGWYFNLPPSDIKDKLAQFKNRLLDMEMLPNGNMNAVMVKTSGEYSWWDYDLKDLKQVGALLSHRSSNPIELQRYVINGQTRYALLSIGDTPITGAYVQELKGLDDIVKSWLRQHQDEQVPGVTLSVARNGQLIYERGFGYSDLNHGSEMTPGARMRIASISREITRRALRQMVDQKMLPADRFLYEVLDLPPCSKAPCNESEPYADPRFKQIQVQHLLDRTSCLADYPPSNYEVGKIMGLGRDANPGERIAYAWTLASTWARNENGNDCVLGEWNWDTHFGQEVMAYVIAKTLDPNISKASYTQVGELYGQYIHDKVGIPIGSIMFQANNDASLAHPLEVSYDSNGCMSHPEWDHLWQQSSASVPCSYAIDFFDRPGSGTIVTASRDLTRFAQTIIMPFGTNKPQPLQGATIPWDGLYQGAGGLWGTKAKVWDRNRTSDGSDVTFSFIVNGNPADSAGKTADNWLYDSIVLYLDGVTKWPAVGTWPSSNLDLYIDYRLRNRLNGKYARALTATGPAPDVAVSYTDYDNTQAGGDFQRWQLQRTQDGYVRLMNRGTGTLISIEHLGPNAESLPYHRLWWSAEWSLKATNGFVRITNRWTGDGLHVRDQTGFVQRGPVQPDWHSADWILEPAPPSLILP